jgi:hypothetical protein
MFHNGLHPQNQTEEIATKNASPIKKAVPFDQLKTISNCKRKSMDF